MRGTTHRELCTGDPHFNQPLFTYLPKMIVIRNKVFYTEISECLGSDARDSGGSRDDSSI